jgi:tRNA(Arg) A34 adenosine deaminase TadA
VYAGRKTYPVHDEHIGTGEPFTIKDMCYSAIVLCGFCQFVFAQFIPMEASSFSLYETNEITLDETLCMQAETDDHSHHRLSPAGTTLY